MSKQLMEIKKETADLVLAKVQHFQKQGELDLPPNYSAANALKSAWLILQNTVDKDKKPVLSVCTKESIARSLLDMVIQGLNPSKKQAYFIAYGKNLTLQRSYFGTKAVCLRVDEGLEDIFAEAVYQGDELEFSLIRGRRVIEKHVQKFGNIDDSKIVAAYAVALGKDGEVRRSELMTIDQIKTAWKQSKMNPVTDKGKIRADSTHGKFTAEMAKRTVTNRLAKHIINSSSDSDLVIESMRRSEDHSAEAEVEAEVDEYANSEVIDITPGKDENPETDDQEFDNGPEMTEEEKQEIIDQEAEEEADRQAAGPGF